LDTASLTVGSGGVGGRASVRGNPRVPGRGSTGYRERARTIEASHIQRSEA
jgi:hypothetical protein